MLSCRCDVSAFDLRKSMCRPSEIDVSTFEDRWMTCRPLKIDDQCVDLQTSMCRTSKIDVSTFEDRWSKWNFVATLAQNIDIIVLCELRRGFALQCFHFLNVFVLVYVIFVQYRVHPESFRSNAQNAIAFVRRNRPRVNRSGEFTCVYLRAFAFACDCEYCTCMQSHVRELHLKHIK